METKNILKINDLKKHYYEGDKKLEVLRGLNLEVKKSEVLGISGPSGAGKSTLLHLIGALDKPSSGEIFFEGKDINGFSEKQKSQWRNKRIGFVFQFFNLLPEFTVLENIFMPALISGGKKRKEIEEKAFQILKTVRLESKTENKPGELSGGEQQRVAIARALMNEPDLILADEPTGNLDRENSEGIFNFIMEMNSVKNKTFIVATHNETLIKKFSRCVHLENGVIK